jgi:hypothetical protein
VGGEVGGQRAGLCEMGISPFGKIRHLEKCGRVLHPGPSNQNGEEFQMLQQLMFQGSVFTNFIIARSGWLRVHTCGRAVTQIVC